MNPYLWKSWWRGAHFNYYKIVIMKTCLWRPVHTHTHTHTHIDTYIQENGSRYRPGLIQRVGRGIALLFHDRGTRRGWVVSSTPRPHLTPGKDPVPILQETGWAPGPFWKSGKFRPSGFDRGPSNPQSVAIQTELPAPPPIYISTYIAKRMEHI